MFAMGGEKALLKKLDGLDKAVRNKIGKKAITAGVKLLAKAIKKEIPSTQKSARKAIGHGFKKPRSGRFRNMIFAKAGAGVGMKKEKRLRMNAKQKEQRKKKKGVGIGVSNIMWLLEGTDKRYTGTKRVGAHKRGNKMRVDTGGKKKYTGRMTPTRYVQKATRKTMGAVKAVIKGEVAAGIKREAGRL